MLASSAWAQSLSLGVKAGMNLARASADAGMTIAAGNGLLLGGYAELALFPPLVLQVGVQYAEHKTSVSLVSPLDASTSSVTHQLNYLEIPIDLKLAIGPPTFQIFGLVGISVGVLMKAVDLASGSGGMESSDYKDSLNKTALAFQVGGGIGIQIVKHVEFIAEARYDMGLKDVNKSDQALLSTGAWKARDLMITGGLNFRFSMAPANPMSPGR
jgi:opacity protein-like surface antigen